MVGEVCEHERVSRTSVFVLVALGAAIAGFAFSTNARRGDDDTKASSRTVAAGPQKAILGWREVAGESDEQIVYSVESLEVLTDGWRVRLSVENRTTTSYEVASTLEQPFGLMVFASGDYEELTELNEDRALPTVRPATSYEPRLPAVLEPGDAWIGTISAPGALVANGWVRVAFGALVSVIQARDVIAWIRSLPNAGEPRGLNPG
jgi:hypothetical protein